ncbi:MAG: hypothetical protein QGH60_17080 [Phycisphaerae bacterium]|nr:hypothetical protein [Phycisphaerae bacterium]
MKIRDKENLFNAAESPQNGAYFPSFLGLLKRTSEFDARTTPKQTRVLDRTISSLSSKAMDNGGWIYGAAGGH